MKNFSTPASRIQSLDVLRGIAVLGILFLNIYVFCYGFTLSSFENMRLVTPQTHVDDFLDRLLFIFVEGKMRGIFSVLFGVSAMVIIAKYEKDNDLRGADIYYKRLMWLLVFGLINGFIFLWCGDILYAYAICGLFLFPLRNSSVRVLIFLIFVGFAAATMRMYIVYDTTVTQHKEYVFAIEKEHKGDSLTASEKSAKESWENKLKPLDKNLIRKELDKHNGNYIDVLVHNTADVQWMESTYLYKFLFFDTMVMMLLGMLLFKIGFFDPLFPASKLLITSLGSYAIGLPLVIWAVSDVYSSHHGPVEESFFLLIYTPERFFLGLAYISTILLLLRLKFLTWIGNVFALVGKMAFTNYLLQSIIGLFLFPAFGLGLFGKLRMTEMLMITLAICIFEIVFSVIWLRFFRLGPFEFLWRSLVYWSWQPFRRHS